MDLIEQSFNLLSKDVETSIERQTKNVFTTLYRVAESIPTITHEFITIFPELESVTYLTEPFNPMIVIDCVDNKPDSVKYNGSWNNNIGILPNRRIVGEYWVDIGEKIPNMLFKHMHNLMYCITHNKPINSTNKQDLYQNIVPSNVSINCECANFHNQIHNHLINAKLVNTTCFTRDESRTLFDATTSHKFNVDNYLNLYHESGLYIMFNKTPFPELGFIVRPLNIQSKRMSAMTFKLGDKAWYQSKDASATILNLATELIPDNYGAYVEFYKKFHKLCKPVNISLEDIELESSDTRDILIHELETQLKYANKRLELIDTKHDELVEMFKKQSDTLAELTKEYEQYKMNKNANDKLEIIKLTEELFKAKKELIDAMSYQAKCIAQNTDIEQLQLNIKAKQQDIIKCRSQLQEMSDQVLTLKKEKRMAEDKICQEMRNNTTYLTQISKLEYALDKTKQTLDQTQQQVKTLELQVIDISNITKTSTLEDVLTARTEELTTEKNNLIMELDTLRKRYNTCLQEYNDMKVKLSNIIGVPVTVTNVTISNKSSNIGK